MPETKSFATQQLLVNRLEQIEKALRDGFDTALLGLCEAESQDMASSRSFSGTAEIQNVPEK